eukprot:gene17350-20700_t
MFSTFGEIESCRVMIDLATAQSRGFGFVKFRDNASDIATNTSRGQALVRFSEIDSATKSIKALENYRFPNSDRPLIVRYADNDEEKNQMISGLGKDPTNLYVYNLPSDADDALLYRLFSPSGAIASVKVVKDPITQACKGFGFVRMVNMPDAINAINSVNGTSVEGKVLQVSFKK